jgi:hypothetical protein
LCKSRAAFLNSLLEKSGDTLDAQLFVVLHPDSIKNFDYHHANKKIIPLIQIEKLSIVLAQIFGDLISNLLRGDDFFISNFDFLFLLVSLSF